MSASSLCLGLALLPVVAIGSGAHEHGVSRLDIAIEGHQISIALEGAGHNFVGFEHEPQTAEEGDAIVQALAKLAEPASLFGIPAAARCAAANVRYEGLPSSDWNAGDADALADQGAHAHSRDHGHGQDGDAGAPGHTHGNWRISYSLQCEQPAALLSIEPRLLEAYQHTSEVRWQLISGNHQDGGNLRTPGGRISLLPSR